MIVDSACTIVTHPRIPILGPEGCMMTHGLCQDLAGSWYARHERGAVGCKGSVIQWFLVVQRRA